MANIEQQKSIESTKNSPEKTREQLRDLLRMIEHSANFPEYAMKMKWVCAKYETLKDKAAAGLKIGEATTHAIWTEEWLARQMQSQYARVTIGNEQKTAARKLDSDLSLA